MPHRNSMRRREFITRSCVVTAGLGVTGALHGLALDDAGKAIEETAHKVGKLPQPSMAQEGGIQYLSDVVMGISTYRIDYGNMLGLDTTTYPLWPAYLPAQPIKINGETYAKGVGVPPGDLLVMLDGRCEGFEADVGVQTGSTGTALFVVIVDDKELFNSGLMTEKDEAKRVKVSLAGGQQMTLRSSGSAKLDWADAKLIRSASAAPAEPVDMAPFARVATWDPDRLDGVRVDRLTEFPAGDLFLDTELAPDKHGNYTVPAAPSGERCIGLQWVEQRRLVEIGLEFPFGAPSSNGVGVEGWVKAGPKVWGYSLWQGIWTPLKGKIEAQGNNYTFRIESKDNRDISQGTYKIRWIFPATGQPIKVRKLIAVTTSIWQTVELKVQAEGGTGKKGEIEVYNGEILAPVRREGGQSYTWDMGRPLNLTVRYTKPRPWGFDRTVIRYKLPTVSFSVAVDDALSADCIYVQDAGVLVEKEPARIGLEQYKASIADRRTILEKVRHRPDQEFEKAVDTLYIPKQDRSPTLISLGWDDRKVVVERSGMIGYGPMYLDYVQFRNRYRVIPQFGSGANHQFPDSGIGTHAGYKRDLDGGWMPMPRITVQEGGVVYQQVVYVAPFDDEMTIPGAPWLYKHPICVGQYTLQNPQTTDASATLMLRFVANAQEMTQQAQLVTELGRVVVSWKGQLLAVVETAGIEPLTAEVAGTAITLSGTLPAKAKVRCQVYMPMWEMQTEEAEKLRAADALHQRARAYWQHVMDPAMQIQIPDTLLNNTMLASQVNCVLASREDQERNIDPWIASTYYRSLDTESHSMIYGMDLMGQHDYARRALEFFIQREKLEGYLAHGYTLIGTGQHLWFLSEHYRLTGDRAWWINVAPKVAKMCQWVVRQSAKTKRLDAYGRKVPEYGLLPPGTVADWQDWGYVFAGQGYYYVGLAQAAAALAEIGYPGARDLENNAEELRQNILQAYAWTRARTPVVPRGEGTWVPGFPYQALKPGPSKQFFPNYDCEFYDVILGPHHLVDEGVLDPDSAGVAEMADYLEDVLFVKDASPNSTLEQERTDWFNRGGIPPAQPYYARYAELCARHNDVKPFIRTYLNSLAEMFNKEDLTIYENPGASVWNKTHETGHFLQQSRLLFVMERKEELWLAPFVSQHWLKDGLSVKIGQAPTIYGPVGYELISHAAQGYIEATVEPPARKAPKAIVLRVRHPDGRPMKNVTVNGAEWKDFDAANEWIKLPAQEGVSKIVAHYL